MTSSTREFYTPSDGSYHAHKHTLVVARTSVTRLLDKFGNCTVCTDAAKNSQEKTNRSSLRATPVRTFDVVSCLAELLAAEAGDLWSFLSDDVAADPPPRMVALSSAAALLHSRRGAAARGRRRLQPLRCALADVTPDGSGSGSVFDAPAAAAMRDEKSGDLVAWSDWADGVPAAPLPPPLTLQQRLSRSAQFWSVLFPLLARYTFWTTQLAIPALAALYTPKQKADVWNALHEQGSTELSAVSTRRFLWILLAQSNLSCLFLVNSHQTGRLLRKERPAYWRAP